MRIAYRKIGNLKGPFAREAFSFVKITFASDIISSMQKTTGKSEYELLDLKRGVDYIGVTVSFYCHDGKGNILMHKRSKNCRDEIGNWDNGGGSMEHGESFEEAVRREVKEEYCVEILDLKPLGVNNVLRKNGKQKTHWVTILFAALVDPKKVKIGESEKMEDIGWFSQSNLPSPLHSMFLTHLQWVKKAGIV